MYVQNCSCHSGTPGTFSPLPHPLLVGARSGLGLANGQKARSRGLGHRRECASSCTKLAPGGFPFSGPQKPWLTLVPQPVSLRPVGWDILVTVLPQIPSQGLMAWLWRVGCCYWNRRGRAEPRAHAGAPLLRVVGAEDSCVSFWL